MEGAAGKSQTTNVEMFSKFKTRSVNQSFEIYLFWKYNLLLVNFFKPFSMISGLRVCARVLLIRRLSLPHPTVLRAQRRRHERGQQRG